MFDWLAVQGEALRSPLWPATYWFAMGALVVRVWQLRGWVWAAAWTGWLFATPIYAEIKRRRARRAERQPYAYTSGDGPYT